MFRPWLLVVSLLLLSTPFAHSASTRHHLAVLGLNPGASRADIKARYRSIVKALRPDINGDAKTRSRFQEVQDAYDHLTKEGPLPDGPSVKTSSEPPTPPSEFGLFFDHDDNGGDGGIPAFGVTQNALLMGTFRPNLRSVGVRDAVEKSEIYRAWQRSLWVVTEVNEENLAKLRHKRLHLVGGSLVSGRNGHGFAWFISGAGAFSAIAPAAGNTALTGINVVLFAPVMWQALLSIVTREDYGEARALTRTFLQNFLEAESQSSLVNGIVAYDFLKDAVEKNFDFLDDPEGFPRILWHTMLALARRDPVFLEGWLLRFLQDAGALPLWKPTSRAVSSNTIEIGVPEAVRSALDQLDGNAASFVADVLGQPRRWQKPLEMLIDDLAAFPELRHRAEILLELLESQRLIDIVANNLSTKMGWVCDFLLANAKAAFVAKSRWKPAVK